MVDMGVGEAVDARGEEQALAHAGSIEWTSGRGAVRSLGEVRDTATWSAWKQYDVAYDGVWSGWMDFNTKPGWDGSGCPGSGSGSGSVPVPVPVPYGDGTVCATPAQIIAAARKIYRNYPEILEWIERAF